MRDWYALGQLTLLPLAATLLLHLALVGVIVIRWQSDVQARTIEARVAMPTIINATLVDAASLKPRKTVRREPRRTPPPTQRPAPQPAAAQPAPSQPAPSVSQAPAESTPAPPRPAPREVEKPRISAEELAAISRRELAEAVESEDAIAVAMSAEEMSASYAALIRETVVSYWSRPPSARNGMEALLAIQLVPTGEVVSVSVVRSSGSTAFDRSAINAVEKAGAFPELSRLPNREFEKTFRRFQLLFRPEDLRY